MKTLPKLTLIALLAAALPAHALGLREAAQLALNKDPRVQASGAGIAASNALVDQAKSGYLPRVTAAFDVGRSDLQVSSPFPQSGARTPDDESIGFSQPLYSGGGLDALSDAADSTLASARQSQRDVGGKIILAALTSYLDVLRDQSVIGLNQANLDTLTKAQSDTQKRYDAGEATKTDVAQSDARVAEARAGLRRATAQLRISEAGFLRLTAQRPADLVNQWPQPQTPATLADAIKLSASAPFVLAAKADAASAKSQIEYAGAGRLPKVSLDGNASSNNNGEFGYTRLNTWGVLVKMSVPLYEGGYAKAKVAEASAKAEQAQYQAQDAEAQFAETATREWEALQATDDVIASYEAQVAAAESALDGVRKELDAGTRTTLDLLDAERELLVSQVNLVGSKHDRAVTAFRLIAACGKLELEAIPE